MCFCFQFSMSYVKKIQQPKLLCILLYLLKDTWINKKLGKLGPFGPIGALGIWGIRYF